MCVSVFYCVCVCMHTHLRGGMCGCTRTHTHAWIFRYISASFHATTPFPSFTNAVTHPRLHDPIRILHISAGNVQKRTIPKGDFMVCIREGAGRHNFVGCGGLTDRQTDTRQIPEQSLIHRACRWDGGGPRPATQTKLSLTYLKRTFYYFDPVCSRQESK